METPHNSIGQLTDHIMVAIRDHIKRDPPPQENHHHNRAWEATYRILQTVICSRCQGTLFTDERPRQ